jgi:membrane carboxypeptidase/penicillin-binding protein
MERGGLKVITTLDWRLQTLGERWVKAAVLLPHAKDPRAYGAQIGVKYQAWMAKLRDKDVRNGALIAMDYQTGEILAYVGSADYYAAKATKKFQPQFDVLADGWRQPGSAFKPFNYVTGIDDRTITAATVLMDVTTNFAASGKAYAPTDYDNRERGPVRVRLALQLSLNIPSIKVLAYNGIDHVFETARKMGLRFQRERTDAGLSMAIGTVENLPVDLATGFATLADGGRYVGHTSILRVMDAEGKDLISPYTPPAGEQIVSPQAAYIVTDMLKGNTDPKINPYWGAFAIKNKNGVRRPTAMKTGTNNDAKDLNAYGYIAPPSAAGRQRGEYALVVGAWAGNSDNTVVSTRAHPVFSLDVAGPIWQGFLLQATRDWEIRDFVRPKGITEARVDAYSGMAPGAFTTTTVKELFIEGTEPRTPDTTKIALQVEAETGKLWADGCSGTPVIKGFLDLSRIESAFPLWQKANFGWIARAKKGVGIAGGPKGTRTTYFYNFSYHPYGSTWGAPFPPIGTCVPAPPPSPSPSDGGSPLPTDTPGPGNTPKPKPTPAP